VKTVHFEMAPDHGVMWKDDESLYRILFQGYLSGVEELSVTLGHRGVTAALAKGED